MLEHMKVLTRWAFTVILAAIILKIETVQLYRSTLTCCHKIDFPVSLMLLLLKFFRQICPNR